MTTQHTLATVRHLAESLWPSDTAEAWDRVGLVSGSNGDPVRRILLAVDAVRETVDEAIALQADLLLTHHPLLLRGVHSVAADTPKGSLLVDLIRARCALLAAHTNADVPDRGVSAELGRALGLEAMQPIVPGTLDGIGIGRVGTLRHSVSLSEFAERVAEMLPATAQGTLVAGDPQRIISRVAVCGGSGDSLLSHPSVTGADVYVTSDLRHHPAQEAIEAALVEGGPALINTPHWASESLWLNVAARQLREGLPGVDVVVSERNTDPWVFRVG